MKIIFLDIDGVLNCENAYIAGDCKYQEFIWEDGRKDYYKKFCPKSKKLLNKLINETDSKIVISSTWRHSGLEFMRKVWELEEMEGEIIGITPSLRNDIFNIPRGSEIKYYLEHSLKFSHINWDKDMQSDIIKESGVENYIIIDDDSDMLYQQKDHFVHVLPSPRNKDGFNQEYYEEALDKLKKDILGIRFQ